ncbi:MAG TPA: nucleotidyltransferase family protein [Solirubrobacteraceae bacterium]|nr:nucleotidyltransferase family protein [Solirubrobacteraceae bacterium]
MTVPPEEKYAALHELAERGRKIERRRGPDPYPRPTGPPPGLDELRARRVEITRVAERHGARAVRVFGSVARGETQPDSDLDVLVELGERRGLFDLTALQHDLEDLLGCPVHVMTTSGLREALPDTREEIEREAVRL